MTVFRLYAATSDFVLRPIINMNLFTAVPEQEKFGAVRAWVVLPLDCHRSMGGCNGGENPKEVSACTGDEVITFAIFPSV